MTIANWITAAQATLEENAVPTARLDCEVLLADALNKDRSWIHAHPEHSLPADMIQKLNAKITRRAEHEPIAYIRGVQEFYGRDFRVSPDTLTPRPETETMIELLLSLLKKLKPNAQKLTITDLGTGSGCIIITAALELSSISSLSSTVSYTGLEISQPALKLARQNADTLGVDIDFQQFDLLKDTLNHEPSALNIILANLPYVPNDFNINLAASHEPEFAIYGGDDGLDYYREMFLQASNTQFIFTESLPPQHNKLTEIAAHSGYTLIKTQDFIQIFERHTASTD